MPDPKSSSSSRSRDRNSAVREQLNALREEIEAALRQGKSAQSEIQDTLAKQHHSVMERLESALKPDVARPSMDRLRSAQEYRQKQPEAPVVDEFSDIRAFSWEPEAPEGRPTTHTRFNFNESKTVEFLVFIAARWPGITPFFVAKVLFFADRDHLRAYGRPVTGDVYIAMPDGPVPSHVYDMVKGNLDFFGDPEAIARFHQRARRRSRGVGDPLGRGGLIEWRVALRARSPATHRNSRPEDAGRPPATGR